MATLLNRRRYMGGGGGYPADALMTIETNPEVLAICYAQGWCSNAEYMTYSEAAAVTSIGTVFKDKNIAHFDELQYFGITSVDNQAFYRCPATSIKLPNALTSIGTEAFYSCGLSAFDISNTALTSIGNNAFRVSSSLQRVVLPSTTTSIGQTCFRECRLLADITIYATTPPTLGYTAIRDNSNDLVIYVPSGSVNTYKTASGWSSFASRIQAIP